MSFVRFARAAREHVDACTNPSCHPVANAVAVASAPRPVVSPVAERFALHQSCSQILRSNSRYFQSIRIQTVRDSAVHLCACKTAF